MAKLIKSNTAQKRTNTFGTARSINGATMRDGESVYINGHATQLDGGQGRFQWNSTSTDTDNNGTIIKLTDTTTGRLIRDFTGICWSAWFGTKADGSTDDLTALNNLTTFCIAGNHPLGLSPMANRSLAYRVTGTWTLVNYRGDIYSESAKIRIDSGVDAPAIFFDAGTPNIHGVLKCQRVADGADLGTDWLSGSFDNTTGIKTTSATKNQWEHIDCQGFFYGVNLDCDGNDSLGAAKRFTECSILRIDLQNCFIGYNSICDDGGYHADVTITRIRTGGSQMTGVLNTVGLNVTTGPLGTPFATQGPTLLSYDFAQHNAGTTGAAVIYDGPHAMSMIDGWVEDCLVDIKLLTPTASGAIRPFILGYNLSDGNFTIQNPSKRAIMNKTNTLGGASAGDALSVISLKIDPTGTDLSLIIEDVRDTFVSGGYNHDLQHTVVDVVKGGFIEATTAEDTYPGSGVLAKVIYQLNSAGTQLKIQLPGAEQKCLGVTIGRDGSGEALPITFRTPFETKTVTATDISALASDNSLNSAGSGFGTFEAGDFIEISGFTGTLSNNSFATVLTATSAKLTLNTDITLVDDAAGESVTVLNPNKIILNAFLGPTAYDLNTATAFLDMSINVIRRRIGFDGP